MEATVRTTKSGTGIDTADALWAIISAQPRKIRKELAMRLQNEFPRAARHTTELDQAVQEAEDGRVSGPFNSAEELFKHLGI